VFKNEIKFVNLFGANNYYSLDKQELLKHTELISHIQNESVLIDEESYNKLQTTPMLPIDDFKHLRFCKDEFAAKHYLAHHFESWGQIDNNTYKVTKLKKEYNF
jgi:hypothetical protein